ncbi:RT0821/Lpp0805 family surface protein [Neoaquamicrobium sediminum]|uniref:RT0821/Lpp0805 family surface protein n=1 Tax=Neoaquamicrobium sediminum TaxID=1849104 RepID=A0ABV3WT93_9HYPH
MARPAQPFAGWDRQVFRWLSARGALVLLAVVALSGCGARGFSIDDAVPDRSIVTGSIFRDSAAPASDAAATSDEMTIRNAVSSALVEELSAEGIGWANAETGSRGAISAITESRDSGYLCRAFTASRESFDGVRLYRGETCLGSAKLWVMKSFVPVD